MVPVEREKCAAEPTQRADMLEVGVKKTKGSKMILVFWLENLAYLTEIGKKSRGVNWARNKTALNCICGH